jgi:hypothetical protein
MSPSWYFFFGINQKGCYKGSVVEELVRDNRLERPVITIVEG